MPTRDRTRLLEGCLASLRDAVRHGDEVIVVDSASRTGDVRSVAAAHGARYVRCDVAGASLARNTGWRAARNDVVAFVDDDVRVTPSWAATIAAAFDSHPDVDFLTGHTDVMPGEEGMLRPVAVKRERDAATFTGLARSDRIGHGANLVVRRDALAALGGFDERLGPGTRFPAAEDLDLFDRLLATGHAGRYEPAARAMHVQWRSGGQLLALDWGYGIGSGARIVKLWQWDRERAVIAARAFFGGWGVRQIIEFAKLRRPFFAFTSVVRVAGGVIGMARALLSRPWRGGAGASAPPLRERTRPPG